MILPAVSGWDYSHHSTGARNRWKCKFCAQNWVGAQGVMLEIFDGASVLHIFCDTAPLKEWTAWLEDRVTLFRKFEPTAALLDASPRKIEGIAPTRIRLQSKASDALWRIILQGSLSQGTEELLKTVQMDMEVEHKALLVAHQNLPTMTDEDLK